MHFFQESAFEMPSVKCAPLCLHLNELTHLPLDKMAAISQTMFLNAISWMKMFEFRLKFHKFVAMGVIDK